MKIQWSVFFSFLFLLTLVSCGSEEFGTAPQSTSSSASPLTSFSHSSCSTFTLIKPKVDILYLVDNSSSSIYIPSNIKESISATINKISTSFDYRIIGTPLLETINGNNSYQVMTNSPDIAGINTANRVNSAGEFSFFNRNIFPPKSGEFEKGLGRVASFIGHHQNALIRTNSHLIVILISNGRDLEVEEQYLTNGETRQTALYSTRLSTLRSLRQQLNSIQLRLISLTASSNQCGQPNSSYSSYRGSQKSYISASRDLYLESPQQDSPNQDFFDLCSNSANNLFDNINNSIQQVLIPHEYRFWPISFAENNESVSIAELQVKKVSPSGQITTLIRGTDWDYEPLPSVQSVNTRELPSPGEPVTGRHFIRFTNRLVHPDCVLVTSVSRTEYFGYVVLPQKPRIDTISLRINGVPISKSTTNGWGCLSPNQNNCTDANSSAVTALTRNIKVPFPAVGDENPPVMRTGFMIQLNGSANYYKSGDSVEVYYIPAGI